MGGNHVVHGFFAAGAPLATYQKGRHIYDESGKKYLDGSSGPCCTILDYGNEEILNALWEQSKQLVFTYRSQFRNRPAEILAEKLTSVAPEPLNWCSFVNSGSEASDAAVSLARRYWLMTGRPSKFMAISRWTSYHGGTIGALSLSGYTGRRKFLMPVLDPSPQVPPPHCYHCPYEKSHPECDLLCAKELDKVIRRLGPEYVSCFMAEPITGASGGVLVPPAGYYELIREICDKHQVLFVVDEVLTGCGRTGRFFAFEHWNAVPDLVTFGKGITSGYAPLAGVLISDKINSALAKDPDLALTGHTFAGNPLSSAVAAAVVEYVVRENLPAQAAEKGKLLLGLLREIAAESPLIGEVRGKGLLAGVEFTRDKSTRALLPRELKVTERIVKQCMANGLLIYAASNGVDGDSGDAVYISPMLTITPEEIRELAGIFSLSLQQVSEALEGKNC